MTTYIGLLRAVNLGSHQQVRMPALRDALRAAGYDDPRTYLQSGNVVFRAKRQATDRVAAALERLLADAFAVPTPVMVRTAAEIASVVTDHPFDGDPASDPTKHYVTFLNAAPKQADVDALVVPREERGRYWVKGREIYQWMPTGRGQTKLDNAFFEKRLGVVGTGRNWRTVTALDALAREVDDG